MQFAISLLVAAVIAALVGIGLSSILPLAVSFPLSFLVGVALGWVAAEVSL